MIGVGRLACQCAEKIKVSFGVETVLFDANHTSSRFMQVYSKKNGIGYSCVNKEDMFSHIGEERGNVLLLSVYNPFIIPAWILDKGNITAINLHHSLLPFHPGMYAEAWAIFEQDDYSGITWHLMTYKVDEGEILTRKKVEITDTTTSYELLEKMNTAAFMAFEDIVEDIVYGRIKACPQEKNRDTVFHSKNDKPNDGVLDIRWHAEKISAFLRAYNYFISFPFGKPIVEYGGETITWKKYTIESTDFDTEKICRDKDRLIIIKDRKKITLIGISELPR